MVKKESMTVEQAFAKEVGINIRTAMKVLNEAGISSEDLSDISNICKNSLAGEIEKRNVPYEFRFLLLSLVLCRMFKTSTGFHKEYMKSVEEQLKLPKGILIGEDDCPDIELAKDP